MNKLPSHFGKWDQRVSNEDIFQRNFLFNWTIHPLLDRPNTTSITSQSYSNAWNFNSAYVPNSTTVDCWNREAKTWNLKTDSNGLPVRNSNVPTAPLAQYDSNWDSNKIPCRNSNKCNSTEGVMGNNVSPNGNGNSSLNTTLYKGVQRNTDNESILLNHNYYHPRDVICDDRQLKRDNMRSHLDFLERETVKTLPMGRTGRPDFNLFNFNQRTGISSYQPFDPVDTWNTSPSCPN